MQSPSPNVSTKIVKAGAGAGKTTDLVRLFIDFTEDFFLREKRWPRIVVTTFTRKATQELKERILHKIIELQNEEKKRLESSGDVSSVKKIQFYEELFYFVNKKSFVQVSTIHGTLSLFLKRLGPAMDLTPDFKLVSPAEEHLSHRKILKEILLSEERFQDLLEDYEFTEIEKTLSKFFAAWIQNPNLRPITAEELEKMIGDRIEPLVSKGQRLVTEIEAVCENEKWLIYLGVIRNALNEISNLESVSSKIVKMQILRETKKENFYPKKPAFPAELHTEFQEWLNLFKNEAEEFEYQPDIIPMHSKVTEILNDLALEYCQRLMQGKFATGHLTMADLELLSLHAARSYPEATAVFSNEWDFWMVDEYQDTSPLQVEILRYLIGNRPCYYVGDPQQSIYLFRGARSEVFAEKVLEISAQGGQTAEKLINYRSNSSVLHFINELFTSADSSMFSKMEVGRSENGANELQSGKVQIIRCVDEEGLKEQAEAAVVADRVLELLNQGAKAEQICILLRAKKLTSLVSKELSKRQIDFQVHGSGGFFSRREIMDTLAVLKFILNPHDNVNFISLLRSPWFLVADHTIVENLKTGSLSYWSQLRKGLENEKGIQLLAKALRVSETSGIYAALTSALQETHFFEYSHKIDPSGRREANIWKLLTQLAEEERRPGFNWLEFVTKSQEAVSGDVENEDGDAVPVIEPQRVSIMTVHASKGLQFDHVILPFLGKKQVVSNSQTWMVDEETLQWTLKVVEPESGSLEGTVFTYALTRRLVEREIKESLRVFYVAATRAKESLTFVVGPKVEKSSWAQFLPDHLEEGEKEFRSARYFVRQRIETSPVVKVIQTGSFALRAPFLMRDDALQVEEKSSITAFLGAQHGAKAAGISALRGLKKAQLGTEMHQIFESLKYTPVEQVKKNVGPRVRQAIDFLEQLNSPPLMQIISEGSPEYGFSFRHQDRTYQGQIDLWAKIQGRTWIIDYKTGSSEFSEEAFAQLRFYHLALEKMKELNSSDEVNLVVIYPFEAKVLTKASTLAESRKLVQEATGIHF